MKEERIPKKEFDGIKARTVRFLNSLPMNARRDAFFARVREAMFNWVNPDGTPRGINRVFSASSDGGIYPNREPFRSLPCLYTGEQRHIDLANAMVARYCKPPQPFRLPTYQPGEDMGLHFNIFQSNNAATVLHKYRHLLTPAATAVLEYQTRLVFEHRPGSAQIDYSFHGCNDNMPAMSTAGLILGGEALNDERAIAHGLWKLKRFRRTLSRTAWASEYNSGTYSVLTLTAMAKIASEAKNEEARDIAIDIEERIWAEILLHWHPGSACQAGPSARSYSADNCNHMHNLWALLWIAFGPEVVKRDLIKTHFEHDGIEVVHFDGYQPSNIVEYVELFDTDLHVPAWLADLATQRKYPARLHGTVEQMSSAAAAGGSARCHTTTYMEESFSLGTVDAGFCGGEQTNSLYVTFKRKPQIASFRDAGVLFVRYIANGEKHGGVSGTPRFQGDKPPFGETYVASKGNLLTLQRDNTAMLLAQAHCRPDQALFKLGQEEGISSLKLTLLIPAHYARTRAILVGKQKLTEFTWRGDQVQPISLDVGEVYIHIDPLVPNAFPRDCAMELVRENAYEAIHLINYRGPARAFSAAELARMLNGCVVTVRLASAYPSFEAFHEAMGKVRIHDYWASLRYVVFQREDIELEMVTSIEPMTVQSAAIDGRSPDMPMMASSEIAVNRLPFVTGAVPRDEPFFPWQSLNIFYYNNTWGIGSRGLPGEIPYSKIDGELL